MNRVDISREKILEISMGLVRQNNMESLNMRKIAQLCGVSVGSIYNYFPTKAELEIAVVQNMWSKVFHPNMCGEKSGESFIKIAGALYERVYASQREYGNVFLTHQSMFRKSSRESGKNSMEQYFEHIKKGLKEALLSDYTVNSQVWTEEFTPDGVVDLVVDAMITNGENNAKMLLHLLEKALYC